MATYNKFNQFSKDLTEGKHLFAAHTFKVMLTNTAPTAANAVKADIVEIAAGNGYTAGGAALTITTSADGNGITKVSAPNVVFTATGSVGPFRYAVLYNDSQTVPAKPLVAWWDYGASITLVSTETFTVVFDAINGIFQIA